MADNKTKIIIETESGSTEQKLKKVAEGLKNVSTNVNKTGKSVKTATQGMVDNFGKVAQAIQAVALGASAKMAYSLAKDAAQFQEVSQYCETMAVKAGMSFDRLVEASKRGANGMASSADIMKANLKALRGGLQASEEDFGKLWKIADAMSDQMGVSITQAFEQITAAITTGNQKSLISMGLMPESFGKVSSAADLLTRRTETLNAVLMELGPQADALASQGDTAADKFTQLDNAIADLKIDIGTQLVPAFTVTVDWLKDIIIEATAAAKALSLIYTEENTRSSKGISDVIAARKSRIKEIDKELASLEGGSDPWKARREQKIGQLEIEREGYYREIEELKEKQEKLDNAEIERQKKLADVEKKRAEAYAQHLKDKEAREAELANKKKAAQDAEAKRAADLAQREQERIDKLLSSYNDLTTKYLPKLPEKTSEWLDVMNQVMATAAGIQDYTKMTGESIADIEARVRKIVDSGVDSLLADSLEGQFHGQSHAQQYNWLVNNAATLMMGGGSLASVTQATSMGRSYEVTLDDTQTKDITKKGWQAVKDDVLGNFADVIVSGINSSNLPGAISSAMGGMSNNYLSAGLSGLLGGGSFGMTNFIGFAATTAISYVASKWKEWTGDKNKEETYASVNNTMQRGSYAYMNAAYASQLSMYSNSALEQGINDALRNYYQKGMTVSWNEKDGDWHWLTGQKIYSDTTPGSTYQVIQQLEDAVRALEEYNDAKRKELEIVEAQGYDYRVLTETMQGLSHAFENAKWMSGEYEFNWTNGNSYKMDLTEEIQDLKVAYYEALREYGSATAQRTTAKESTFLAMAPYLNLGWNTRNGWTPLTTRELSDYVGGAQEALLDREASVSMLNLVKYAGKGQYDLAALQFTGSGSEYAQAYIDMLDRQMKAAKMVMDDSEDIYTDMTKTFEEQSAALEMYENAQNTYYQAKLEMLQQEQAKEEQLKKEEQQAALRSAERMEALLGFTGEMAKTGDKVYILQGGDTVGALKELIANYGDDPETLAALQSMLSAAQNKAKFGRI